MKKTNPFVAFVAGMMVAALVFAGIAGMVLGQDDEDEDEGAVTLYVIEHITNEVVTDLGEEGDTVGDVLTFANEVWDEDDATMIGMDNGFCLRTSVGVAWECNWTVVLEDGTITVEGPFYDVGDSVFAIIGGTGEYDDVSGQMTLQARNSEIPGYDFVYEMYGVGEEDD